jgi:CheY-like chemotaxis protein
MLKNEPAQDVEVDVEEDVEVEVQPVLVLLIEHHRATAERYRYRLELEGFRVSLAANGAEGLAMAKRLRPDLIVLDLHLPDMGGIELLERLRADEGTRDLHAVILTHEDSDQLRERAHQLGVLDFLDTARVGPGQLSHGVARWTYNEPADGDKGSARVGSAQAN